MHEVGHALWELIDEAGKTAWLHIGNEEDFADHFMNKMLKKPMCEKKDALFNEITKVNPPYMNNLNYN